MECLLCHVTGGRLSKAGYCLRTMETAATDHMNEQIDEERAEAARMAAEEIFEEIEPLTYKYQNDGDYIFGEYLYDLAELKKKYIGGQDDST